MKICAPLFISKFYYYSCGSVPRKGRELAIQYIRKQIKNHKKTKYFCKLDIKKFFENIKPLIAFRALRKVIADKKTLLLFARILRFNKVRMPNGEITAKGLPIGFYTSPWIANLVITEIDHIIKEKLRINVYVRYIDDMILFHSDKRKLMHAVNVIICELSKLGLQLKYQPAIHLLDKQKVTFVGFQISRNIIKLNDRAFLRTTRSINKISKKKQLNVFDAMRVVSSVGKFKYINGKLAFQKYVTNKISLKHCVALISRKDRCKNGMAKSRR